jgi:hypothetical protein
VLHPLRLAGLFLVVLSPGILAVAPPPRPLGPPEIQRLIEQLDHRDYRLRELAERRLSAQGAVALPLLKKALGHGNPEIRRRALRLVPGLEHAALVAPRRVTMSFKNQPIRAILQELGKATGYTITHMGSSEAGMMGGMMFPGVVPVRPGGKAVASPKEPTFSYTFINEPFWDVIERLCQDSNLTLQAGYGDETVRLYQGTGYAVHVGRDGAFRYSATGLQMYRNIDLGTFNPKSGSSATRNESLTFSLAIFAEPRLPILSVGEPRIEAAYDNERNSLVPKGAIDPNAEWGPVMVGGGMMRWGGRVRYYGGHKQSSIQSSLHLQRISEKATSIKLLKGMVPLTIIVEQKPIALTDDFLSAKGKKTLVGDLEFNIETVQKMPNNQFQVKLTVTNKAGNPNDYTWQNSLYNRFELVDAKGVKYQTWGSSTSGGRGTVTMTLTYNGAFGGTKPGPPTRFIYQHWVTKQHDVMVEFKDVPLP